MTYMGIYQETPGQENVTSIRNIAAEHALDA